MKDAKNYIRLGCAFVTALAFVQAIVSVVRLYDESFVLPMFAFCVSVIIVSAIVFCVNGYLLEGFLVRRAVIKICSIGMEIHVFQGDILKQDGVSVIGVNDFFDTTIDDKHIRGNSVHGQVILSCWPGSTKDLDSQIEDELKDVSPNLIHRDGVAKEKRYPIGTSALVKTPKGQRFILTALSETNPITHKTQSSLEMLVSAIKGALSTARDKANGDVVSFCVMGGDAARIKASQQMLFTTLLTTLIAECQESKVSKQINIVLHKRSSLCKINLHDLEKEWRL